MSRMPEKIGAPDRMKLRTGIPLKALCNFRPRLSGQSQAATSSPTSMSSNGFSPVRVRATLSPENELLLPGLFFPLHDFGLLPLPQRDRRSMEATAMVTSSACVMRPCIMICRERSKPPRKTAMLAAMVENIPAAPTPVVVPAIVPAFGPKSAKHAYSIATAKRCRGRGAP